MSAVLLEPKMASQIVEDSPKIGSVLPVEVEQALPDLLMVSLKSGGKVFRGVLIDSNSGACPVGVPDPSNLGSRLNKEFGVPVIDTAFIKHEQDPGTGDTATKVEDSALSFRQSYFQNMPLPPARPLLFGKKEKTPEIKPKTISHVRSRQFRLRPRQLLCSKCKGACHSAKAKTAASNRPDKNGLKKRKADSSGDVVRKKPRPDPRVTTNGGTHVAKPNAGASGSRPLSTPAKSVNKSLKKTSPAIKISYATPGKGQRLIVRIPPRTNNFKQGSPSTGIGSKNKNRVLTVPLSPLSSLGKHTIDSLKKMNGLHKAPVNTQHDKIRIVKTKGTYSIPSETLSMRTYGPLPGSPKIVNGKKLVGNVTVKPITLLNGYRPLSIMQKKLPCTPNILPPFEISDTASDCSSYTSRGSRKGGKKGKQNGSINNNNSEYEFDSDASSTVAPKKKEEEVKPSNHKKNVTKSILPGGRTVCVGDIIWGKITGFPWWPGRIVQIIVTRSNEGGITLQEAQITWFASRSISFMPLTKLPPFLGEFKKHYDKKRKGLYKEAISQATKAAEALSSELATAQGKSA
ncbi:PWWP domain-containing protein 2A isoform X2 [Strongylocentrotus purpuratus]|uniref:PWWP domain-containing protein n=1 Tax=Strongylocentrotus purpuratus TaxID=7668 RepID=A0A7M7TH53_STRPU|nr:PWWP domain-containing protein 2A isoform X2 [Strongylocentrotus purpuratus]